MRKTPKTTKELLTAIPEEYSDAFYENLENFTLDELWDFIAELMPIGRAEKILEEITEDWQKDEIGTPYKMFKKLRDK